MDKFVDFITKLMSGEDNQTPAIGRYLAALVSLVFLVTFPAIVVGVLLLQHVTWDTWKEFFMTMVAYVPASIAGVISLVRVLHPTEPKAGYDNSNPG